MVQIGASGRSRSYMTMPTISGIGCRIWAAQCWAMMTHLLWSVFACLHLHLVVLPSHTDMRCIVTSPTLHQLPHGIIVQHCHCCMFAVLWHAGCFHPSQPVQVPLCARMSSQRRNAWYLSQACLVHITRLAFLEAAAFLYSEGLLLLRIHSNLT